MILKLIRSLQGYVRIRITGYSPERFLNLCSHHHIYIWGLHPTGHSYEMFLTVKGFLKLKPIVRKTGMKVSVVRRYGLPFWFHRYRKRYCFFGGALVFVCLIYFLSLHIWNIHIDGNYSRTDSTILEFLETKEVRHGMRRSSADCSRIVRELRKEYDDVIWASASLSGTRLLIQIKENMDTVTEEQKKEEDIVPSDLFAAEDGVIVSMITRRGVPAVEPGMQVKAGDLLVSGQVPVLNDSKEVAGYQYCAADADIILKTEVPYTDTLSLACPYKIYGKKKRYLPFLQIGAFRLEAGTLSGLSKTDRHEALSTEYRWKLGEHFYLPVTAGMTTIKTYRSSEKIYTEKEFREILSVRFSRFCRELEKKGVQILQNNVKIYKENDAASARGSLTVQKPAGERRASEKMEVRSADETESED